MVYGTIQCILAKVHIVLYPHLAYINYHSTLIVLFFYPVCNFQVVLQRHVRLVMVTSLHVTPVLLGTGITAGFVKVRWHSQGNFVFELFP